MDPKSVAEGVKGTSSSLEQDTMTLGTARPTTGRKQSSEDTITQNLAIKSKDLGSAGPSVLDSDNALASAAQRALDLIEIVGLIATYIAPGICSNDERPDILKLMHVNRVWRAAAQPFLLREIVVYDRWKVEELAVSWHPKPTLPLGALLRDAAHLLVYTNSLVITSDVGDLSPQKSASAFDLLTRCTALRELDVHDNFIRAWSKVVDRPLVRLSYLQRLELRCTVTQLQLVPFDIPSMSNLKEIRLYLKVKEGGGTIGTPRSIDWLGRLFLVGSDSLRALEISFDWKHALADREFAEIWSAIRPHLKHITRLSLDLDLTGQAVADSLDDLPDSLKHLLVMGGFREVQFLAECLQDPAYLPHLVAVPRLYTYGYKSFPEMLRKQVIQGLKARKGLKWTPGEVFMGIPMDFDGQAG